MTIKFKTGLLNTSTTDSVKTPPHIIEFLKKEFQTDNFYDPVPFNPNFDKTKHTDALTTEWGALTYINPPYSRVRSFFKKAVLEWKKGKTIIMLIKIDNLATEYFREYGKGCEVWILSNKLRFAGYNNKRARFASCFVIMRANKISDQLKVISLKK